MFRLRRVLLFIVCVAGIALADITADLDNLYLTNQWFQLRDAVIEKKVPAFYKGAVAVAFNDPEQAAAELGTVIKSEPNSQRAFEASLWLQRMYALLGRRKDARDQLRKTSNLLRSPGIDRTVAHNFEQVSTELASEAAFPDLAVVERRYSRLPFAAIDNQIIVPLTVNGKPANYILDTGSDESSLSEAEAKRFGLTVRPASIEIETYGGHNNQSAVGTAVAGDVRIGGMRLRNVSFMVRRDKDAGDAAGIIGLPVLLALETVRWNSDGILEVGFPAQPRSLKDANLCLVDGHLVVQAEFQGRKISLFPDTGTYETLLFPTFARDFGAFVMTGTPETKTIGDANVDAAARRLPVLRLRLGGSDVASDGVHALSKAFTQKEPWASGNLGMDFLMRGESVTLDFQAMKLTIEGGIGEVMAGCPLPPNFACTGRFACIARLDPDIRCHVDRTPMEPLPGNALPEPTEGQKCTLPEGFRCRPDEACTVVFDSPDGCRIDRNPVGAAAVAPSSAVSAERLPAAPAASDPGVQEIVRRSLKTETLDLEPARDYVYAEDIETRTLDADGNPVKSQKQTKEVMTLYDQTYERLVARNGKPLPPNKAEAEQARFEKAIAKRAHETEQEKAKREEAERKQDAEAAVCNQEFLKDFTFRLAGVENLKGRPAWIIDADPLGTVSPRCNANKILTKFHFRLWIDKEDYYWARYEADNIAPVSLAKFLIRAAKGGLHVTFELAKINGSVWLPSFERIRYGIKLLALANVRMEIVTTYSHYRKFQSDSRLVSVSELK
ncbi:MAG TPA: aspartyl protease family protein [Bryobacteraceae bacterium]|nr:aspartyl protease family protein [Bryobacteraceae bacterium]